MFHRLIVFLTDVRCDGSTDELRVGPAVLHTTICMMYMYERFDRRCYHGHRIDDRGGLPDE